MPELGGCFTCCYLNRDRPEAPSSLNPELVHIVYLADLLMSRFHPGLELERLDTNLFTERLESIGLSTSQFPEIVELIPGDVFDS